MKKRILSFIRKFLLILLTLAGLGLLLLLTPRLISALNSRNPPTGYYFIPPTVAAVYLGIESLAEKSPAIPENIEVSGDIEYKSCNGKSLFLDIYHPARLLHPAPLLLFIHGGSWSHGTRNEYLAYALHFAGKGYVTATVSYRFVTDATFPACSEDIHDAVLFLLRNSNRFRFDPDKLVLVGGSAGAHLAMLEAYGWARKNRPSGTSPDTVVNQRIKAVVDMYGPTDLTTTYARENRMVTGLIGHSYRENPRQFLEASPLYYADKLAPPTLILHGSGDNLVPLRQAEMLKEKLDSLGIPNICFALPGWPHTMDLVARVHDFHTSAMADFFGKYVN